MDQMPNRPSFKDIMQKKEVKPGKDAKLEKGDFLALTIAATSVILPFALLFMGIIGLFIYLIGLYIG